MIQISLTGTVASSSLGRGSCQQLVAKAQTCGEGVGEDPSKIGVGCKFSILALCFHGI